MKSAISSFFGFLLGGMIYSGLMQYHDTHSIDLSALILNPKHWFIATFVGLGVFLINRIKNRKKAQENQE